MTDIRRIGDSGVHTVEGNVAGGRAARLTKERDKEAAEYERIKSQIKEQNAVSTRIDDKFNSASEVLEQEFRQRTVGLMSAEEFRKARSIVDQAKIATDKKVAADKLAEEEHKKQDREKKRKKMASTLSFSFDDGDGENGESGDTCTAAKKKVGKDTSVDTSWLPDKERDKKLQEEKEQIAIEWIAEQEKIKKESLEVIFSYWDGSGHRRATIVEKGLSIGKFLEKVKSELVGEFSHLRLESADSLMYIKEDLIIPHHLSFYDLIITKARGKSGPLFHFDVHDDVRLIGDASIEKDESHPGKIVERRWYERNKHIFPASRWEVYQPSVERTERYTIHGGEIAK
jgi:protein FAM50